MNLDDLAEELRAARWERQNVWLEADPPAWEWPVKVAERGASAVTRAAVQLVVAAVTLVEAWWRR